MDKLSFVVEMTKATAWPAVVVLGVLQFRAPLIHFLVAAGRALRRVNRMKVGDLELEVAAEAVKAAADAAMSEAAAATEKIVTEELPTQEKVQLLEQIQLATLEAKRYEALYKELKNSANNVFTEKDIVKDVLNNSD